MRQSPSFLCFLVKTIFGEAAIKDERFVRKRWRFGELATVTHMGVLKSKGCNLRSAEDIFTSKLTFHFTPTTNEPLL